MPGQDGAEERAPSAGLDAAAHQRSRVGEVGLNAVVAGRQSKRAPVGDDGTAEIARLQLCVREVVQEPSVAAGIGLREAEAVRRAAIDTAWGDEQLHASGRVMLGQSTGDGQAQPGFLVFSKLTLETVPDGISARTPYVGGFLFAAFRAGDLFEVALAKAPLLPVNVAVYDGAIGPENLLYRSHTPPASSYGSKLLEIREVTVAGRTWTIEFRPTSAFAAPVRKSRKR